MSLLRKNLTRLASMSYPRWTQRTDLGIRYRRIVI